VDTRSSKLLDGHIVRRGREIKAIPLLEALEMAECPSAPILNRRVQVSMRKHPKLHRIIRIGRPDQ